MTQMLAQYVLQKAESAILEVQDDDDNEEEEEEEEVDATDDAVPGPTPNDTAEGSATATEKVEGKATRRPGPLNLNGTRARNKVDDFGEELPDTPGGWKEEWDI